MTETATRNTAMTFFRAADAPTLDDDGAMTYAPVDIDPEVFGTLDVGLLRAGEDVRVLFKSADPDGFSLVSARFGPGYRLPRHSHSADCLYYVVSGEAHMGSRVLKPGDGFFIAADAPYTYTAGPDGVEVLEFRHATTFDIKVRDTTVEQWKPIAAAVAANGARWAEGD
jgi:quercetin dioxygenase-like cupin family protein